MRGIRSSSQSTLNLEEEEGDVEEDDDGYEDDFETSTTLSSTFTAHNPSKLKRAEARVRRMNKKKKLQEDLEQCVKDVYKAAASARTAADRTLKKK